MVIILQVEVIVDIFFFSFWILEIMVYLSLPDIVGKTLSLSSVHYPGTDGSRVAEKTGKQLWSSEDYSTFNDNVGAGCWARVSAAKQAH